MKLFFYAGILAFLSSCSVLKDYTTDGFTSEGNTILYNGAPMAQLVGIEFALDDNKFVKEMTFKLLNGDNNDKIHNLIAFLHNKHSEYEIEVEIPIEHVDIK